MGEKDFLCYLRSSFMPMKKLVIFDLDGTLVNTIADLAIATNHALAALGYPTHEVEEYPLMVGGGINKLFFRALPEAEKNDENVLRMRSIFLPYYDIHNTDYSKPYDGIPALLSLLQARGVKVAVASNKYHAATQKIISHFFPNVPFVAVLGQREGVSVKPDPAIVCDILSMVRVEKDAILYVGDSGIDVLTAHNAGLTACAVTWGFRPRNELEEQCPEYIVDSPEELSRIIFESPQS